MIIHRKDAKYAKVFMVREEREQIKNTTKALALLVFLAAK